MLKASQDYVVIEVLNKPNNTTLILPDEESGFGKVLDIGPLSKGNKVVFDVGDTVYFDKFGGMSLELDGKKIRITSISYVLAKVD